MLLFQKPKIDYKRELSKEETVNYTKQLQNNPLLWLLLDELEAGWYSQFKGTLKSYERDHYHCGMLSIDRLRSKIITKLQSISKYDKKE